MFSYNASIHEASKFTPFEIVLRKIVRTPSSFPSHEKLETYGSYLRDLILQLTGIKNIATRNLISAKNRSKQIYDRKLNAFTGKVGDKVYVKRETKPNKLDSKSHGPYTIVEILDKHTAILETTDRKRFQKHADKPKVAYE